jgi:antitoxin CptB
VANPGRARYMTAMDSDADALAVRRKRLRFRAWHRGMKEVDLILGRFADRYLDGFDAGQLDRFEALMEAPDAQIYSWYAGSAEPPAELRTDVWTLVRSFSVHAQP